MSELLTTPLHRTHVSMGARMVPFSGWDMPVQYATILEEVDAVREKVGIFDVSHMGRLFISGPGAGAFVSRVFSTDVSKLRRGRAKYGVTCNEDGGIIDDNIVYRLGEDATSTSRTRATVTPSQLGSTSGRRPTAQSRSRTPPTGSP